MPVTQLDLNKSKQKMIDAGVARDNEWSGSAQNSTGYSVLSWIDELQKCSGDSSAVRDADGNLGASSCGSKGSCSNSTYNQRCANFGTALNKYQELQTTYMTAKADYAKLSSEYTSEAPAIASNVNAGIKVAIVVIVVAVLAIVGYFLYKKYK